MLAEVALLLLDIFTSDRFLVRGAYLVPVLAVAMFVPAREVAAVAAFAIGASALSPVWNETGGDEYLVPLIVTAAGSAIAVLAARGRVAEASARAQAEAERRQLRLLADAARITDGAADIDEALQRLGDLLVPDFADATWIDVSARDGTLRRLAARVDGPDAGSSRRWLMRRGATRRMEISRRPRARCAAKAPSSRSSRPSCARG